MKRLRTIVIAAGALLFGGLIVYFVVTSVIIDNKFIKVKNAYKAGGTFYVGSQITARVEAINVEVGTPVEVGQTLITLNASDIARSIDTLRDDLKTLKNKLKEKQVSYQEMMTVLKFQTSKNSYLSTIKESNISTSEALKKNTEQVLELSRNLFKDGAISKQEMQHLENEYQDIKNKYEVSTIDKQLFEDVDVSAAAQGIIFSGDKVMYSKRDIENQIEVLTNDIAIQEGRIDRYSKDLSKSIIVATVNGVVGNIFVNIGEVTQTGQKLIQITQPVKGWVDALVSELDIQNVKIGSLAHIVFKSIPQKVFHGRVTFISSSIQNDLQSSEFQMKVNSSTPGNDNNVENVIRVKLDFDDEGQLIQNGISATVMIFKE